ncbi:alpha/beta fold hydrolase [Thermodesulfobacteriota bacterium]
MKMQIRGRAGTSCMVLSILVLFAVSVCATSSNAADLNLTYIGEAIGPNANLSYFLQGPARGETVVLLPGLGRGADEFRELAAALNKAGYRTVAVQSRGIGRSGPVLTNPSYELFADDVALVLKDIPGGIAGGKAHLLGYEFGNRIARMFAVRYPERVGSLVLLACGGQKVSSSPSNTKASKTTQSGPGASKSVPKGQSLGASTKKASSPKAPALSSSAITQKIDSFFGDLAAETKDTDPQDVTLSGMIGAFAFWLTPSEREHYVKKAFFAPMSQVPYYWITGWYRDAAWMQQGADRDHSSTSADWVSGGSAPMLILNGQYDVAAPIENATFMKKTYPDRVTLVVVPDAGHAMLAEQPAFIINHVISYLEQHPIVLRKNTP